MYYSIDICCVLLYNRTQATIKNYKKHVIMVTFDKDKAYMELLLKFRKLISEKYRDGGWLPPAREMCKEFDVCSSTYVKATSQLVMESVAQSFPRKGIYIVPKEFRIKKIGIVIGDGQEAPFIYREKLLSVILDQLDKAGYESHLIQGSPPINVGRCAISHYVAGLIWLNPSSSASQAIKEINDNRLLPLIVVDNLPITSTEGTLQEELPVISEDLQSQSSLTADFFISRGHKKLGLIDNKWAADHSGLTEKLKAGGISLSDNVCVQNIFSKRGRVKQLVTRGKITGLIITGGARYIDAAFSELSELPENLRPEILVSACRDMDNVFSKYPEIKSIAVRRTSTSVDLGNAAVDMLVDNLSSMDKIVSRKIKTAHIEIVRGK